MRPGIRDVVVYVGSLFFLVNYAATAPALEKDDISAPSAKGVPKVTTVISEETKDGVKVMKLRFASTVGSKEGEVKDCEFFFANIPGGTFQMGQAGVADKVAFPDGDPETLTVHSVTISAFRMGVTEVTQEQYEGVMGTNPAAFRSGRRPVEKVSWYDAVLFCNALSKLDGKDPVYQYSGNMGSAVVIDYAKNGYRLPTEAEWEYAYRAGTTTDYYWGASTDADTANKYAWWYDNSEKMTHPVAQKTPNAWGLYDMAGNVWEWVGDGFYYSSYPAGSVVDPTGPPVAGDSRVLRGSSWYGNYGYGLLRASYRLGIKANDSNFHIGFRVASRP